MNRRLYFLIPDVKHAERLVRRLVENGIGRSDIHSIARRGVDISRLPKSSEMQKNDTANKVEEMLWRGNLVLFFFSLAVALLLVYLQSPFWAMIPVAVMLISFFVGFRFATRAPNAHINELSAAVRHGEVLLLVDVPKQRVREIETLVSQTHPEAAAGGVGWSLPALQL